MTDPSKQQKMSSQMEAVVRLMTGKEERTIAEKLADSNRPSWEQYKKDNQDKLDLVGDEQRKMQAYREELDEQRDRILSRGVNHATGKKKKKKKRKRRHESDTSESHSDSSSDDDSSGRHTKKKKRRRKKEKRKRKHAHHSEASSLGNSDESQSDNDDSHYRRKRKHKKKKRKRSKRKSDKEGDGEGQDDRYRLSSFFTNDDDDR